MALPETIAAVVLEAVESSELFKSQEMLSAADILDRWPDLVSLSQFTLPNQCKLRTAQRVLGVLEVQHNLDRRVIARTSYVVIPPPGSRPAADTTTDDAGNAPAELKDGGAAEDSPKEPEAAGVPSPSTNATAGATRMSYRSHVLPVAFGQEVAAAERDCVLAASSNLVTPDHEESATESEPTSAEEPNEASSSQAGPAGSRVATRRRLGPWILALGLLLLGIILIHQKLLQRSEAQHARAVASLEGLLADGSYLEAVGHAARNGLTADLKQTLFRRHRVCWSGAAGAPITGVTFRSETQLLVSSLDGRLALWDAAEPSAPVWSESLAPSLRCLTPSPRSADLVALGDGHGFVYLFDVVKRKVVWKLRPLLAPVTGLDFSGDGRQLLVYGENQLLVGWPSEDGWRVRTTRTTELPIVSARFFSADTLVFAAGQQVQTLAVRSDSVLAAVGLPGAVRWPEMASEAQVAALAVGHAPSASIAVAMTDNHVFVCTPELVPLRYLVDGGENLWGHVGLVYAHRGNLLAAPTRARHILLWDQPEQRVHRQGFIRQVHSRASNAGMAAITGVGCCALTALAFSPSDRLLVSGDAGGHLVVWTTNGVPEQSPLLGDARGPIKFHKALVVDPEGRWIAASGEHFEEARPALRLHSAVSGQRLTSSGALAELETAAVTALAFHAGVLAVAEEGTLHLLRLQGSHDRVVCERLLRLPGEAGEPIRGLWFGPKGTLYAARGTALVQLFVDESLADLPADWAALPVRAHALDVGLLQASPAGDLLAVAEQEGAGSLQLFRVAQEPWERIARVGLGGQKLRTLAFGVPGTIVYGLGDGSVWRWSYEHDTQEQIVQTLTGSWAMALSPDLRWVISGGRLSRLQQWDLSSGEKIQDFGGFFNGIAQIGFLSRSKFVASANEEYIRVYDLDRCADTPWHFPTLPHNAE